MPFLNWEYHAYNKLGDKSPLKIFQVTERRMKNNFIIKWELMKKAKEKKAIMFN